MTAPATSTPEPSAESQAPAAAVPAEPSKPAKPSLEDSLATLDDATRAHILGEVAGARTEAKNLRDRLKAAEPRLSEYDRLVEASKTELERAQEAASTAAAQITQYQSRAIRAEIRAASSDRFVDADVPFAYLDTAKYLTPDGDVDTAAIQADLADLLVNKPGLARAASPRLPGPNPAQGGSANGAPTLDDQMAAAVKSGDTREQIRIQNLKLAALAAR